MPRIHLLTIALAVLVTGCGGDAVPLAGDADVPPTGDADVPPTADADLPPTGDADVPVPVASLELTPSGAMELAPGAIVPLTAIAHAADGTELDRPILWASSDETVATVSASGQLHAHAEGAAQITARCEGHEASLALSVRAEVEPVVWIEIVESPALALEPGAAKQLHVIAYAAGGEVLHGRPVSWSSSAASVASVSATGLAEAHARGTATITAEVETRTAEVEVAVELALPALARDQAGGETHVVAIEGDLAYVGVGPRLTIWDLAAEPPVVLGESAPLAGVVTGLAVRAGRAYVATTSPADGILYVVDVSTPGQPIVGTALELGTGAYSRPSDVAVAGSHLFVTDQDQGLFALSLDDPDAPEVVAYAPAYNAIAVQPVGDRVHVVSTRLSGLVVEIYGFSSGLELLGSLALPEAFAAELTTTGLVVSRGYTGVAVDDLANPSAPERRFTDATLPVWTMVGDGARVWLTVDGEVRCLDLTDPGEITLGAPAGVVAWAVTGGAAVAGRLVLVDFQGWLTSIDVTDPARPVALARVATAACASCYATARLGDLVVVAETTPGAVGTLGTATGGELDLVGRHMELSVDFEDLAVVGDRAYVADWFTGLWVFELSIPGQPQPITTIETGGYPAAIAAAGGRVYLGEDTSWGGALRIFSSGATGPVEIGAIATENVSDLAVAGDLVFVTHFSALRIYDAADPTSIVLVGAYEGCGAAHGVAVSTSLAVVGCSDGLHVVDVSDPTAPVQRSVWPLAGVSGTRPVALDGDVAYLGHDRGVTVVDLGDPDAPVLVAERKTAWLVRHLAVLAPGRLAASTSRGGVYQWQL